MNDMSPADEALRTDEALPTDAEGFAALGLHESLLTALAALGYEEPTPIQREAIPPIIEGRDLLGQAATGMAFSFATTYALGHLAKRYYAGGRQMNGDLLRETYQSLLGPARELQTRYLPQIEHKAATLDAGQVMAMIRGQQGSPA